MLLPDQLPRIRPDLPLVKGHDIGCPPSYCRMERTAWINLDAERWIGIAHRVDPGRHEPARRTMACSKELHVVRGSASVGLTRDLLSPASVRGMQRGVPVPTLSGLDQFLVVLGARCSVNCALCWACAVMKGLEPCTPPWRRQEPFRACLDAPPGGLELAS